jgi:hypothetical protein
MQSLRFLMLLTPMAFAGEFWNERKAADWTAAEKEQFLQNSPWAKTVSKGVDVTRSAVKETIYGPSGGNPGKIPGMRAVIRWESAAPVREALGKPLPEGAEGHLVVSVTMTGTLSVPETSADQLRATSLQAKGRVPVNPELLLHDAKTGTIYFLFPEGGTARASDKEWVFETALGGLVLKARFVAHEMKYLGKPGI